MSNPGFCEACSMVLQQGGFCPTHLTYRPEQEEYATLKEQAEKRAKQIVRRYILKPQNPTIEQVEVEITKDSYSRIQAIMDRFNHSTFDETIGYLGREAAQRYDPMATTENNIPLVVTGPAGTGKTYMVSHLLKRAIDKWPKVFIIDPTEYRSEHDQYGGFEKADFGMCLGSDIWKEKERFRYTPDPNPLISEDLTNILFKFLLAKTEVKDFVIVMEDAVRYAHLPSARTFVAESRKFVRKCIVVCQDPKLFEGMGEQLKP